MPSFTFKTDANFTFVFLSYSSKRENGKCKIRTTEKTEDNVWKVIQKKTV